MGCWLERRGFERRKVDLRELEGGFDGYGIVLEHVLSRRECKHIVEQTELLGYGRTVQGRAGGYHRGCRRLLLDDAEGDFVGELWRRMAPFVPRTVDLVDGGCYEAVGLSRHLRFQKYFPGEGYAGHLDKPAVENSMGHITVFTVNIYLNDLSPLQGGRTRFYARRGATDPSAIAGGSAGSAALFGQALLAHSPWHEAEALVHGLKYLLRTDVLYSKKGRGDHTSTMW
eukprot:TRINITY_DN10700_c0_g1_i1.p1 TRINITY_DN10700_c0_g1~~TRINITY_DN10700_c0_g1_i1.p1  ORF type:complete len:228 (+),score=38.59 TRINITY_DN10700_c0_g1_i1:276-959(+)